jgi:hypothetical protein
MKYYFKIKKHYLYKEVMVIIQNKEDLILAADVLYYCIITPISFLAAALDLMLAADVLYYCIITPISFLAAALGTITLKH